MITPTMKISMMLKQYPETLEVMLGASPHFSKLKNEFLRRTLGSKVNVEQAAKIAGVSLPELIAELNKKINVNLKEEEIKEMSKLNSPAHEKPLNLNNIPKEKIIDLDVRNDIKNGQDPIYKIKPAINILKDDEYLHIINSFEPVPLYTVLGSKGFLHYTEKIDNTFHVYFFKLEPAAASQNIESVKTEPVSEMTEEEIIELDVRELAPPEPMMKILSTLPIMNEKTVLLVHHHREPMMLYDKLEEKGFTAVTHKVEENYYKVIITKK